MAGKNIKELRLSIFLSVHLFAIKTQASGNEHADDPAGAALLLDRRWILLPHASVVSFPGLAKK